MVAAFRHMMSFSSVRDQPAFSFLVLRNVNKFAGPCETSPGCFDSSCSCTVPVTQVSGEVPSLPLAARNLGVGKGFNAHHGTGTVARDREGPNNLTLLCSWDMAES